MKKEKNIKVLIVEPLKEPRVAVINNELQRMQHIVDGYIEVLNIESDVDIVINEEGKMNGMLPNRGLYSDDGTLWDIIFGTFFIAGSDYESGEFVSLPDDKIEFYKEKFHHPELLTRDKDRNVITQKVSTEIARYVLEDILLQKQ